MSTNANIESSILAGKLPIGFCPTSEQARLEAYVRAMSVSPASGRPGQRGEKGEKGDAGASGIPTISWGTAILSLSEGDLSTSWTIPSGISWQDVRVFPIQLGQSAISSIEYNSSDHSFTITFTAEIALDDGVPVGDPAEPSPLTPVILFTWPIYSYPTT